MNNGDEVFSIPFVVVQLTFRWIGRVCLCGLERYLYLNWIPVAYLLW